MIDNFLIFDLGMHRALDTEFYLKKGFRVVALEANPRLVKEAQDRLASYIDSGQLTIVEKALWKPGVDSVKFFVNNDKDDWSSVLEWWSRKGNHDVVEIEVESTTLEALVAEFGIPYYIKCDIEGADLEFMQQLPLIKEKPFYVSVEPNGTDTIGKLAAAGYSKFQLVNQAFNGSTKSPKPAREGEYHDAKFNGHMSGLFGKELPEKRWVSADTATERHSMFRILKKQDPTLAHGWLDVHATRL